MTRLRAAAEQPGLHGGFAGPALGASRGEPWFFVFGRAGIHRTETNARSKSCSRTSGGRTHVGDFLPLNADDCLIARSRQEDGERRESFGRRQRTLIKKMNGALRRSGTQTLETGPNPEN